VCAITGADAVTCWGGNDEGELGRGTRTIGEEPQPIEKLRARDIALGADHACAITPEGAVHCWGSNRNGQIGDNTTERRLKPTPVQF
jgi:alpha-tubulin suppressor-like RCC1 family protein